MPRFFLDIFNGMGPVVDEEGVELDGLDQAIDAAIAGIRSLISEEARTGLIDLTGHIDIRMADGAVIRHVDYPAAFQLKLPGEPTR